MKPRHRFNFLLVLILAVGLSLSFGGSLPTAVAQVTGPDPSLTDGPANITTSGTLQEGFQMTYNVTVYNNGDSPTVGALTLEASLPQHVTFVSSSSASFNTCTFTVATRIVSCVDPATSPLSATSTAQVSIVVSLDAQSAGTTTTNFTLTGGGDVNTGNNNRSVTTTTAGSPDLTVTKNHVGSFFSKGNIEQYTFVIKNNGSAASSAGILLSDPVAPIGTSWSALGLDFVSVDPSSTNWTTCGVTSDQFHCTYATSIPSFGESSTLTINVRPTTSSGSVSNNAGVSDTLEPASFTTNNTSPTDTVPVVNPPDLFFTSMTPQPSSTFTVGATGQQFSVVINNTTGAGATTQPITVTGTLPSDMTFNATGSGGGGFTCSATGQTVNCVRGSTMAANTNATFVIPVNVTSTTPSPALSN